MDETDITESESDRIFAKKVEKQVVSLATAERGTLITVAIVINATRTNIFPIFIFPNKSTATISLEIVHLDT